MTTSTPSTPLDQLPLEMSGDEQLTSLDSDPGIVHMTSDMGKDLGPLETQLADSFTVCS